MRILLLGATGRTGKLVLQEAIAKNYSVNCIVRNLPAQQPPGVTFFVGNPDDPATLRQAIQDCHAIVSVLNISRASDFPWAKLRTPKTFLSDVMRQLITLALEHKINRLVICSAWGVAETSRHIPGWFKWFIDHSNIGIAYTDHERQEVLVQQSNLNWTIVRPTGLLNSSKNQEVIESYSNNPKPYLTISRLSVAKFILQALSNTDLIRKAPVISGKYKI